MSSIQYIDEGAEIELALSGAEGLPKKLDELASYIRSVERKSADQWPLGFIHQAAINVGLNVEL
ncbi:MAG: hypothetical protein ACRBBW_21360 [Cellvibrionaceae bacterium]